MNSTGIDAGEDASNDLRQRAMRLSAYMAGGQLNAAVEIIFAADQARNGRFTLQEYDRLAKIVDVAAAAAKRYREAGENGCS